MSSETSWPRKTPTKIIVRMPNWLGDLVMATPILADLRDKFQAASITAMAQSNAASVLQEDPHVDHLYSYTRPSGWVHRRAHLEIIERLKKGNYDLGVLLTNSLSSAWWFWRGNVTNRLGYRGNFRRLLLDKSLSFSQKVEQQHLVVTYKELLKPLGVNVSNRAPRLYVSPPEKKEAELLLSLYGAIPGKHTIIGINPGAAFGSAKCWLPERFVEVTKKLLDNPNVFIFYFGDQPGTPLVNEICSNMPDRVVNLAGKTSIRELMALIEKCTVFLSNDSGPMHLASALGTRLVALFGSTSDVKTGPYGKSTVIHKHVECSPCYKRVCPIDFRCMKRIEAEEVYQALIEQIQHEKNG